MTTAIIQSRMGSTRLPGKVIEDLAGKPMLQRVVERVQRASSINEVIVATSTDPADDRIESLAKKIGVRCFRGHATDVLSRYYQAASMYACDTVVRITADCPFIDPEVIDSVVAVGNSGEYDYVSNIDPPTFPDGLDVEALPYATLQTAFQQAEKPSEREHVTLYIRQHPELFRLQNVTNATDLSGLRWVVDEPRDLEFARKIYQMLGDRPFSMNDVLEVVSNRPALGSINEGIIRNEGLRISLRNEASA